MSKNLILMIILHSVAQLLVWIQINGQFKWEFAKNNMFVIAAILAIPISYLYVKSQTLGYDIFDQSLWSLRLVGFSIGIISFGFYTWLFTSEILGVKNFISLSLAIFIIMIQVFWR